MRRTFFLALAFTPGIAIADDLTIVSKVTRDGGAAQTGTSYISSDRLRIAQPEGDAIIEVESGNMTVLDNKKKTYYVVTKEDLDAMAAMVEEHMNSPEMRQMQEQMKNLPPETRKRLEGAMGGMFAVDVKKAGTTRKVAGYECENWTIKIGEMSTAEHCVTNELQFPAQTWKAYRNYTDSLKSLMGAMGPVGKNMEAMREQFAKMKGYPLATTTTTSLMGRQTVIVNEVESVKRGEIPATAWEIPAGYKKVHNPMVKAMRGPRN
jgi:hypothetical protein